MDQDDSNTLKSTSEYQRLQALKSYQILDTLEEEEYDNITKLACNVFNTNISLISLVDEHRQWFKSKYGLVTSETPRDVAFCNHAINNPGEVFVVENAKIDNRFKDNPLVTGDPNVVFYAGAPIIDPENNALGTLCIIHDKPRKISAKEIDTLKVLAQSVVNLLNLRKKNLQLQILTKSKNELLNFINPFYLNLDNKAEIISFGSSVKKFNPDIINGDSFFDHYVFDPPFDFNDFVNSEKKETDQLFFFSSKKRKQKFRFSIQRQITGNFVLVINPNINSENPLSNFSLKLNDFNRIGYIGDYFFAISSLHNAMRESKNNFDYAQNKNRELTQIKSTSELLQFVNPFFILLNEQGEIVKIGSKFSKIHPKLKIGDSFLKYFKFDTPFVFDDFIHSTSDETKRLFFFKSINEQKRYKFSVKKNDEFVVLAISPVINRSYPIKNYGILTLSDFAPHDYISEYLFMMQTNDRAMQESANAISTLNLTNQKLRDAQGELSTIARLPSESPNIIIRINYDLSISYINNAAFKNFIKDFNITEKVNDELLIEKINELRISDKRLHQYSFIRNDRNYILSLLKIDEHNYINIYGSDVT